MTVTATNTEENISATGSLSHVATHGALEEPEASDDMELEARVRSQSTVVSMLRLRAQELPEQLMLTFIGDEGEPDEPVTAQQLDVLARRVAALLQGLGAANQRVLLALQPGRMYCAAFWGCLYANAMAVPVYPPVSPALAERVQNIAKDCGATLVLTDRLIKSIGAGLHLYAPHLRDLQWIELEDLPIGSEELWQEPELSPDDLAFLQYTSGTTADPKGVMISHENITANLKSLGRVGEEDLKVGTEHGLNKGFSWLPPFHDMGLTGMLLPVATGAHLATCSPMVFVRRPERWIREISQRGANVSGGPNFAYELAIERAPLLEGEKIDLSQWLVAVSGAEHVRSETLDRFCATYERYGFRRESFCPSYGMAEATLYIASLNEFRAPLVCNVDKQAFSRGDVLVREQPSTSTIDFVGCGSAGPDLSVVIVDTETMTEVAPGKVGEIWAKGPNIGHGYWGKPELTKERFGAMLSSARPGLSRGPYMRTGDNGFWHRNELFVAGRIPEILALGDRTLYPAELELTAASACDLLTPRGGAAFTVNDGDGERMVLVHELQERGMPAAELAPAIAQALLREHGVTLSELVLIRKNSLLRTSSGKPRRRSVREAYLEGRMKVSSTWKLAPG
jgi:acyl-CoA synthetase (AMP-forming)/AMP-acid ligase II